MDKNQHTLFTASGCLTPQAFEQLQKAELSASELLLVKQHLESCPLCAIAYEGIQEVDISIISSDLEEVKKNLKIVRPLDFMPEKKSLKLKLRVRLLTLLIIAAIALVIILSIYRFTKQESSSSRILNDTTLVPFRLEKRDAAPARLEKKVSRRDKWKQKVKQQQFPSDTTK